LKTPKSIVAIALLVAIAILSLPLKGVAADVNGRVNVLVDCHCPDSVGQKFCSDFKEKVRGSAGYQLAEAATSYGMGVHFSCVDMWEGIDSPLAGTMSAVSVAFTIYSDKLPGEVYEDSSVFRVGKDAAPEMSRKIIAALGQLIGMNSSFFDRMRAEAGQKPAASPSPPAP
jgi:hypothetical protein